MGGFSSRVHPSQAGHTILAATSIHTHHQKVQEIIQKLKMVKNIFLPSHLQRDLHLKAPSGLPGINVPVGLWEQINNSSVVSITSLCTHLDSSGALPDPSTPHRGCHPLAGDIWACPFNLLGQKSQAHKWALDDTFPGPILHPHRSTHWHLVHLMLEI